MEYTVYKEQWLEDLYIFRLTLNFVDLPEDGAGLTMNLMYFTPMMNTPSLWHPAATDDTSAQVIFTVSHS